MNNRGLKESNARKAFRLSAAVVAAGLLVAGCSSGKSTSASAQNGSPGVSATIGGTPADASASPVLVGFDNLESSTYSLADIRIGFEQGLKYVNEKLGGIKGHPLKALECKSDLTPASEVNCANQFVQANVVANVQGSAVAAVAALPILKNAGIPQIILSGTDALMDSAKGQAFNFGPSYNEVYAGLVLAAKKLGKDNILFALPDLPSARPYVTNVIDPTAQKLGLKVTVTYFRTTESDWTTQAATLAAKNPGAIMFPVATDQQCAGFVPALKAVGYTGPIVAGHCTDFVNSVSASDADGVYVGLGSYLPKLYDDAPASVKQEITTYLYYMGQQKVLAPANYALAYVGFDLAVNAANMLNQTQGEITAANVRSSLPHAKGPLFLNTTTYDCSGANSWPDTSSCATGLMYAQFDGNKKMKVASFSPVDTKSVWPSK